MQSWYRIRLPAPATMRIRIQRKSTLFNINSVRIWKILNVTGTFIRIFSLRLAPDPALSLFVTGTCLNLVQL
jgi:hypothetical protein